jgi:hypothetical protein
MKMSMQETSKGAQGYGCQTGSDPWEPISLGSRILLRSKLSVISNGSGWLATAAMP